MNPNFNFSLQFGNKNVLIVTNEDPKSKKVVTIGEGAPWETIPYLNAISHITNQLGTTYEVMEPGLYLHQPLDVIVGQIKNNNVGYTIHTVLNEMVEAGLIRRDLETKPGVYRLKWNGLYLTAEDISTYHPYDANEHRQITHNRDAFRLIMALEALRKAVDTGTNIRLLYSERQQRRVDLAAMQWGYYLAGDFQKLADSIKNGVEKAATYDTLSYYSRRSSAAISKGSAFEMPETVVTTTGEVASEELIGKSIQFVTGGGKGTTLAAEWTIVAEEEDLASLRITPGTVVATMGAQNLGVYVVTDPSEKKESKPKAARKSTRKAARKNEPLPIVE